MERNGEVHTWNCWALVCPHCNFRWKRYQPSWLFSAPIPRRADSLDLEYSGGRLWQWVSALRYDDTDSALVGFCDLCCQPWEFARWSSEVVFETMVWWASTVKEATQCVVKLVFIVLCSWKSWWRELHCALIEWFRISTVLLVSRILQQARHLVAPTIEEWSVAW